VALVVAFDLAKYKNLANNLPDLICSYNVTSAADIQKGIGAFRMCLDQNPLVPTTEASFYLKIY
jgi:hypothetical protein